MADLKIDGFAFSSAGAGLCGKTVNLYERNTTACAKATDTTDSNGNWGFTIGTVGGASSGNHYNDDCASVHEFDIEIVCGSEKIRRKFDDAIQVEEIETANLLFRHSNGKFKYDIVTSAITADRQLNLPLITATQTLVATGTAIADCSTVVFGTGSDASIKYDGTNLVIQPRDTGTGNTVINDVGILFLNETANAKMTTGITINQAGADDEIIALKSSDVAHGMTCIAETDTYASLKKFGTSAGGLLISGFSEANNGGGVKINSYSTGDCTCKGTSGRGYTRISNFKKCGTTVGQPGANANLLSIEDATATRFIFDVEGQSHSDGCGWTVFDDECDIQVINDIDASFLPQRFGEALTYNRCALTDLGIIGACSWYEKDGKTHAMVNWTKMAMLHHGAIKQVADRVEALETENVALRAEVKALSGC